MGRRCPAGTCPRPRPRRASWRPLSRTVSTLSCSAAGRARPACPGRRCLGHRLGLPLVATRPIQFQEPDDFEAHEARTCIAEGETLGNPKRIKRFTREQAFQDHRRDGGAVCRHPSAIANTVAIARRCALTLVLGKPQLPTSRRRSCPTASRSRWKTTFRELSHEGLEGVCCTCFPMRPSATRSADLCGAPGLRDRHDFEDGFRAAS